MPDEDDAVGSFAHIRGEKNVARAHRRHAHESPIVQFDVTSLDASESGLEVTLRAA